MFVFKARLEAAVFSWLKCRTGRTEVLCKCVTKWAVLELVS